MLIGRIYRQALATPDRIAVVSDGLAVGFGRFAGCIEAARRMFAGRGFAPGELAVLVVPSAFDAWVLGLGLRALGVTTLAAPNLGELSRLGPVRVAALVVTTPDPAAEAAARALGARLVTVEAGLTDAALPVPDPDGLAAPEGGYVLLTSGTTGTYKKVLFDAATEALHQPSRARFYGVTSGGLVQLLNLGGWTGAGYNVAMCAWAEGAGVVITGRETPAAAMADHPLTSFVATPIGLEWALSAPPGSFPPRPRMELTIVSGVLSRALWEQARERITPRVFTSVGSTECAAYSRTLVETAEDLRWHRPDPGRRVEAVDDAGRVLPAGEVGLLRIGIVDNVRGYLADPQASAEFFRDGFFYPGDLALFRQDGRFALQGRATDVVSIQGVKIPTAPIEIAVQEALGARGACLLCVEAADGGGEEHHLFIEGGRPPDPAELAPLLSLHLPGVAQVRLHHVESMPRNHTGKIQRAVLRASLAGR